MSFRLVASEMERKCYTQYYVGYHEWVDFFYLFFFFFLGGGGGGVRCYVKIKLYRKMTFARNIEESIIGNFISIIFTSLTSNSYR